MQPCEDTAERLAAYVTLRLTWGVISTPLSQMRGRSGGEVACPRMPSLVGIWPRSVHFTNCTKMPKTGKGALPPSFTDQTLERNQVLLPLQLCPP